MFDRGWKQFFSDTGVRGGGRVSTKMQCLEEVSLADLVFEKGGRAPCEILSSTYVGKSFTFEKSLMFC